MSTAAARGPLPSDIFPAIPPDVTEFCSGERSGLLPLVIQAMHLAARAFAPASDVSAEVEIDPDTDERRVVVNVTANLPAGEMLERYRAYTRQWVGAAPGGVRECVRLSFHTPQEI